MNNNDDTKKVKDTKEEYPLEIRDEQTEKETDDKSKGMQKEIMTKEIMTRKKVRSKQEEKALKLLNEMEGAEDFPISPQELGEMRSVLGKEQLAAFLVGTCHPEMSYDRIAGIVGCDRKTLWAWRQDTGFGAKVKEYGEKHIESKWLPVVRGQIRKALREDTLAATFLARVLGKGTTKLDITASTPEMKRLSEMTDEELEIHLAELRVAREDK